MVTLLLFGCPLNFGLPIFSIAGGRLLNRLLNRLLFKQKTDLMAGFFGYTDGVVF